MAKARPIDGLHADDPYAAVAARVVATRTAELLEASAGVLDTNEIEAVHDMRVASRRLRAALEVFEPCFARKRYRAALREVKALADALGERRDRDVTIAALERLAAGLGRAERPGVQSLITQLAFEQAEANRELAPAVSEERLAALGERLERLVGDAESRVPQPPVADAEQPQNSATAGGVVVVVASNGGGT